MKAPKGAPLFPDHLGPDPLAAFSEWFYEAREKSGMEYANAACLSTVNEEGAPHARIVLIKELDSRGFVFFTNYRSAKGRQIAGNPRGALTFYWDGLHRQVGVRGKIEQVSAEESDEYFRSRPRQRQIGAWASNQSEPLQNREVLEERVRHFEAEFPDEVPRPPHWGGYRLLPHAIEFWQGAAGRLHDRFLYRRTESGEWRCQRLNP